MKQMNQKTFNSRLLWIFVAAAILMLSQFTTSSAAPEANRTVPPQPKAPTLLVGPIMSSDLEADTWVVAGVEVDVSEARINTRIGDAHQGAWARVEGEPDEAGGLDAERVKVLPHQPFIRVRGTLDSQTDNTVVVDGIEIAVMEDTIVAGNPQPGWRVHVHGAMEEPADVTAESESSILVALRIFGHGPAGPDHDDDDDVDVESELELTGQLQYRPDSDTAEPWVISGISVTVTADTKLEIRVGPLASDAWVKVEGSATGDGGILAAKIRTTSTKEEHKLEGILDSRTETEVVVSGITLMVATDVKIEDDPTPGQKVEVKGVLLDDGSFLATKIEGEGDVDDDDDHDALVRFVGTVHSMPDGDESTWVIGGREVTTVSATTLNEHKANADVGALVKVVATWEDDNLIAVEITVLRSANSGNNGPGHGEVEFEGSIHELPPAGLRGKWTVNSDDDLIDVIVNGQTELDGNVGAITIGTMVKVEGRQPGAGPVIAEEIEILDGDDGGDGDGD